MVYVKKTKDLISEDQKGYNTGCEESNSKENERKISKKSEILIILGWSI